MRPTSEQIAVAAYHRWQGRDHHHGRHDEDWQAAERDLTFGLNYRWAVRHALRAAPDAVGPFLIGGSGGGGPRRCRFCERASPSATFLGRNWSVPAYLGNTAVVSADECDDCRDHFDEHLGGPFEAFVRPLLDEGLQPGARAGVPVAALKALVRMGLALVPAGELHHFEDALEWSSNPDDHRDAALLDGDGLGCHVYETPEPVPAPFASIARRSDDDSPFPYMIFLLGSGRVVLQTVLPFSPRDEGLEDDPEAARGPLLSLSLGRGEGLRSSRATFLALTAPAFALGDAGTVVGAERSRY